MQTQMVADADVKEPWLTVHPVSQQDSVAANSPASIFAGPVRRIVDSSTSPK